VAFTVIVIGNDAIRCDQVARVVLSRGYRCVIAQVADADDFCLRLRPDVVVVVATDTAAQAELSCVRRLNQAATRPRCAFLAAASNEDLVIAALRAGAQQYVKAPWTAETIGSAINDLIPAGEARREPEAELVGGERLIGESATMRDLRGRIQRAARTSSTVLILGETGTGKELVAELLHRNGPRAQRPFICINTAAIPDALLENELFGHERGAFTGATTTQTGTLTAANGGTVFLDEIADVSQPVQAKLLRAIENKTVHRLGGAQSVPFDARIVAATNGNLERLTAEGHFRQDLYYRLNVVRVEIPPLRERPDDIPLLIGYYLAKFNRELGRSVRALSSRAMDTLRGYRWPGNIRELRNVIEALLVNLAPETTGTVDVPPEVLRQLAGAVVAPVSERERLLEALTATNWNKSRAAKQLKCSRMTLYRKLQLHGVARS